MPDATPTPAPPLTPVPLPVPRWLTFAFFISGFGALLYQVVWQRSLFALFGINVESVSIVVSAFMLGLGLGSQLGGTLSKRPWLPALPAFAALELGIGAFGFSSLALFEWVGARTAGMSQAATAAVTFLLLLFPTLLMGATLPLLVSHAVRRCGNVGRSVGLLYFVNTLGSAAAAIAAVIAILAHLGQQGSVTLAACLNVTVGLFVLSRSREGAR